MKTKITTLTTLIITTLMFVIASVSSQAQVTIARWNVYSKMTASQGIPENTSITPRLLTSTVGPVISQTNYYYVASWNNQANTGCFMTDFNTTGYENISVSFGLQAPPVGPKEFAFEYRLDGTSWIRLSPLVTIPKQNSTTYFTFSNLPTATNQGKVYIRILNISNLACNGGTTNNLASETRLVDLHVRGTVMANPIQYTLTLCKQVPPGSNCTIAPEEGTYKYNAGTQITLNATTSSPGFPFKYWLDVVNDIALSASTTYLVPMNTNKNICGVFETSPDYVWTIVGWNFLPGLNTNIANQGVEGNINVRKITREPNNKPVNTVYNYHIAYNCMRTNEWGNPGMVEERYWITDFSTAGYKDIKLVCATSSDSLGPRNWSLQYRIEGGTWKNLLNYSLPLYNPTTPPINNSWSMLINYSLPAECENQGKVYVRWITTSNTPPTGVGSVVNDAAFSSIADVRITGKIETTPQVFLTLIAAGKGTTLPSVGTFGYKPGTKGIQISAIPDAGSVWMGWKGDTTSFNLTLDLPDLNKNYTYIANFMQDPSHQITIVGWNFKPANYNGTTIIHNNSDIANYGIKGNINERRLTAVNTSEVTFDWFDGGPGLRTPYARTDNWRNIGMAQDKYWVVDFTTLGYRYLDFTSRQYSTGGGPKDFRIEYSTDGYNWAPVPSGNVEINSSGSTSINNTTGGTPNNPPASLAGMPWYYIPLPIECWDREKVYLRWLLTSNYATNGNPMSAPNSSGGPYNQITNIFVTGQPIVRANTYWIGVISEDWFVPGNWSNGVPDGSLDAVIGAAPRYPKIKYIGWPGAMCRNLYISEEASVINNGWFEIYESFISSGTYINNDYTFISGHWYNTGVMSCGEGLTINFNSTYSSFPIQEISGLNTHNLMVYGCPKRFTGDVTIAGGLWNDQINIYCGSSTVTFLNEQVDLYYTTFHVENSTVVLGGNKPQTITSRHQNGMLAPSIALNNLTINNSSDNIGHQITLNSDVSVNRNLNLVNGIIKSSSTGMLICQYSATVTGGSIYSFVAGNMQRNGQTNFKFPVGGYNADNVRSYAPVTISNSKWNAIYEVEYHFEAHPSVGYCSLPDGLSNMSKMEWWDIKNSTPDNPEPLVTLHWDRARTSGIENIDSLALLHFDSTTGEWDILGKGGSWDITEGGSGKITTALPVMKFSPFTFGSFNRSDNPLPVELICELKGKLKPDGTVLLEWGTASEFNSDRFELERSTDGLKFDYIGYVKSEGNSATIVNYNFTDINPVTGNNYYRLRQIDTEETETLYPVINVKVDSKSTIKAALYPNPCNDILTVKRCSDNEMTLMIYNCQGSLIQTLASSSRETKIDISELPSGIYMIRLTDDVESFVLRFVRE
jgi:hypothetical protein